ncbi:MAG: response regulator [Gammaproteobacteria bacterium]|uniref:response regulator n=1 Tax=Azohydromonas sp. TaxID=1872666 RepID=UPI002C725F67|nr:response regulator [Azohydromonas sp.]HMM86580.1 response regulator [Azohydromonas sp.]
MNRTPARLLVVDDDEGLRELLVRYLRDNGYEVAGVADGAAMRGHLATHPVDLLLLDVMLPGEDGLSLARTLSAEGAPAIIMLSARGDEVDRIVGLEVGADDYLAKPFSHRELLARVSAVLRRRRPGPETGRRRHFGPYTVDLDAHRLTRNGAEVALSGAEFALLRTLLDHPDRVLSRDTLVELLKGYDRAPFDRMVDVRVTRLRRKIEPDPAHPVYLRTVWGVGYLFCPRGAG